MHTYHAGPELVRLPEELPEHGVQLVRVHGSVLLIAAGTARPDHDTYRWHKFSGLVLPRL